MKFFQDVQPDSVFGCPQKKKEAARPESPSRCFRSSAELKTHEVDEKM